MAKRVLIVDGEESISQVRGWYLKREALVEAERKEVGNESAHFDH